MIGKVIEHINSLLADLVEKNYGLCDLVETNEGSFPAFYEGDELIHVTDFDSFFGGLSYIRKNGETKHTYPDNSFSNRLQVQLNIPLKLVLFVPERSDAYDPDRVAYNVIKLISDKMPGLREGTKAKRITILTTSHDTDSNSVLRSEHAEIKPIDPKYCYLSVDFEIEILINQECINECCL